MCYSPWSILKYFFYHGGLDDVCWTILQSPTTSGEGNLIAYVAVFLLTCSLEAPIYFLAAHKWKFKPHQTLHQILVLNLATHPLVYWVFPRVMEALEWRAAYMVTSAEVFAIVTEALLLKYCWKYSWRWAWGASLIANLFSWWAGSLLLS